MLLGLDTFLDLSLLIDKFHDNTTIILLVAMFLSVVQNNLSNWANSANWAQWAYLANLRAPSHPANAKARKIKEQESIPVGCIPTEP